MMDLTKLIEYEQGSLSHKGTMELFSDLIKSGQAWQLQGHYGRTASQLIDLGYITKEGTITKAWEEE